MLNFVFSLVCRVWRSGYPEVRHVLGAKERSEDERPSRFARGLHRGSLRWQRFGKWFLFCFIFVFKFWGKVNLSCPWGKKTNFMAVLATQPNLTLTWPCESYLASPAFTLPEAPQSCRKDTLSHFLRHILVSNVIKIKWKIMLSDFSLRNIVAFLPKSAFFLVSNISSSTRSGTTRSPSFSNVALH